jgi:hypothetical protein
MRKLSVFLLFMVFVLPIQPAQALGCAQVKTMIKSFGGNVNFSNVKGAQNMVLAYKTAFENPKCISTKDLKIMKGAAKELIAECSKPNTVYRTLFTKPIFTAFCGGFKKLEKYAK